MKSARDDRTAGRTRRGQNSPSLGLSFSPSPHLTWLLATLLLTVLAGCRQVMDDEGRRKPLEASTFFEDGRLARPLVPGTVPRGHLREDTHLYLGRVAGEFAETFPFPIDRPLLEYGRERFNIFCAPCHDQVGYGQGMIVRRGFQPPPSFHEERLREAPPGYIFDVITNGFGAMYSLAEQVPPRDRWAIIAYIRALQLSQRAEFADLGPDELGRLP